MPYPPCLIFRVELPALPGTTVRFQGIKASFSRGGVPWCSFRTFQKTAMGGRALAAVREKRRKESATPFIE
jgi:hypothetical protein